MKNIKSGNLDNLKNDIEKILKLKIKGKYKIDLYNLIDELTKHIENFQKVLTEFYVENGTESKNNEGMSFYSLPKDISEDKLKELNDIVEKEVEILYNADFSFFDDLEADGDFKYLIEFIR